MKHRDPGISFSSSVTCEPQSWPIGAQLASTSMWINFLDKGTGYWLMERNQIHSWCPLLSHLSFSLKPDRANTSLRVSLENWKQRKIRKEAKAKERGPTKNRKTCDKKACLMGEESFPLCPSTHHWLFPQIRWAHPAHSRSSTPFLGPASHRRRPHRTLQHACRSPPVPNPWQQEGK